MLKKNLQMKQSDLLQISESYGAPIYVYDADLISDQYNRLCSAFAEVEELRLHYAVKANSNLSILKLFNHLGAGLDTVSIQEVQLGIRAGVDPKKIILKHLLVAILENHYVILFFLKKNIKFML